MTAPIKLQKLLYASSSFLSFEFAPAAQELAWNFNVFIRGRKNLRNHSTESLMYSCCEMAF